QARITKYYQRDSTVIFPPVETERFRPSGPVEKEDFYLTVGRQIPYKRIDLAVQACTKLRKRLIVIGRGSEHEGLKAIAGPTIEFKFVEDDQDIVPYFQRAKALIFPSLEDFGITPVEAMAAGTPVIAYQSGGALDYVIEGKTGLFFKNQTVASLCATLNRFEEQAFARHAISMHAEQFSEARFMAAMRSFVLKGTSR
ncbi:MAG: glycosyltransferase, partial [Candidatus Binatia bacterium]